MNIFLERKKEDIIIINNKEIHINLSFNNVMKSFEVLRDDTLNDYEKAIIFYNIFVNDKDIELDEYEFYYVIENIFVMIDGKSKGIKSKQQKESNSIPIFDWSEDSERIFSSFLMDYNINLIEEDMHWYDFSALLNNLSPETPLMQAIKFRAIDIPKGKDEKEYRQYILKMKDYYELESTRELRKQQMEEQAAKEMALLFDKFAK